MQAKRTFTRAAEKDVDSPKRFDGFRNPSLALRHDPKTQDILSLGSFQGV